jgi:hypothetical protein
MVVKLLIRKLSLLILLLLLYGCLDVELESENDSNGEESIDDLTEPPIDEAMDADGEEIASEEDGSESSESSNYNDEDSENIMEEYGNSVEDSESETTDPDNTAPEILSSDPADNDTNVSIYSTINITFSEKMLSDTITTNTEDDSCSGTIQITNDGFVRWTPLSRQLFVVLML